MLHSTMYCKDFGGNKIGCHVRKILVVGKREGSLKNI